MTPLPTHWLVRGALAYCAWCAAASAAEPWYLPGPPAELAAAPHGATFGDGTECPWAPPPLPPLPGADLWEQYDAPLVARGLYAPRHAACRQPRHPLRSLVGEMLDGFLGLFSFPARRAAAHEHCQHRTALSDCGCRPPASAQPAWIPPPMPQPIPVPADVDEGRSPATLAPPAVPADPPAEPPRLYPGRAPVIELAPDPVLPPPENLLPRNQIPTPGNRLPKNVIPPR